MKKNRCTTFTGWRRMLLSAPTRPQTIFRIPFRIQILCNIRNFHRRHVQDKNTPFFCIYVKYDNFNVYNIIVIRKKTILKTFQYIKFLWRCVVLSFFYAFCRILIECTTTNVIFKFRNVFIDIYSMSIF